MTAITITSKVEEDGSVYIPQETVGTLGLQPGDEIRVRLEADGECQEADQRRQAELRRKAILLFEEADRTVREPSKPLTDPLEAAWAEGVEAKARRMGIKL